MNDYDLSSYLVQIWMKTDMGIAQIIQISSMFIGPLMAFFVAIRIYKHQKREENLVNLNFAIASLSALLNNFYLLKDQIIRLKYLEAENIEKILKKPKPNDQNIVHLNMEKLWLNILDEKYEWPLKNEILNFIAKQDPNVILLMGVSFSSVSTLEGMVKMLNRYIEESRKEKELKEEDIIFNVSLTKNLYNQLDSTLYLLKKLVGLLVLAGEKEFGKKFKIELATEFNISLVDIEPPVIESWERVDWLPVRESRFQKFVAYFGLGHGAI